MKTTNHEPARGAERCAILARVGARLDAKHSPYIHADTLNSAQAERYGALEGAKAIVRSLYRDALDLREAEREYRTALRRDARASSFEAARSAADILAHRAARIEELEGAEYADAFTSRETRAVFGAEGASA